MNEKNCPVCGGTNGDDSQNVTAQGNTVQVCCGDCAEKFKENPNMYAGATTAASL